MPEKNIFSQDVEVPEIVRERADTALLKIKQERKTKMEKKINFKRLVKPFAAAAACAVLMVGVFMCAVNGRDRNANGNGIVPANVFSLQVNAQELKSGNPVSLVLDADEAGKAWAFNSTENGGISYCINTPITCEGEGVESITYSVNKGAFQLVEPKENTIVADGEKYIGELNTPQIGGEEDETTGEETTVANLYKSFTVLYQKQSAEHTWINLCNVDEIAEADMEAIFLPYASVDGRAAAFERLFDGTVITCTVNFEDGTSKTAIIKIRSQILTSDDSDKKEVALAFELQ